MYSEKATEWKGLSHRRGLVLDACQESYQISENFSSFFPALGRLRIKEGGWTEKNNASGSAAG